MDAKLPEIHAKGFEILETAVIQKGPFVKVQIHIESRAQSSTPPRTSPCALFHTDLLQMTKQTWGKSTVLWCILCVILLSFCEIVHNNHNKNMLRPEN